MIVKPIIYYLGYCDNNPTTQGYSRIYYFNSTTFYFFYFFPKSIYNIFFIYRILYISSSSIYYDIKFKLILLNIYRLIALLFYTNLITFTIEYTVIFPLLALLYSFFSPLTKRTSQKAFSPLRKFSIIIYS